MKRRKGKARRHISLLLSAVMVLSLASANGIAMTAYAEEDSDVKIQEESDPTESSQGGGQETQKTTPDEEKKPEEVQDTNGDSATMDGVTKTYTPDADDLPNSDELFAGYVERTLYGAGDIALFGNFGNSALEGLDAKIYEALKSKVAEVAEGTSSSTTFVMTWEELCGQSSWTAEELGLENILENNEISQSANDAVSAKLDFDLSKIMSCLRADCPYELYWYDKTKTVSAYWPKEIGLSFDGTRLGFSDAASVVLTVPLPVAKAYAGNGSYTTNTELTSAATSVVDAAKNIVAEGEGKSDDAKLTWYKEQICKLVSYNHEAAEDGYAEENGYGDPWQLIYVFDGNSATNVVCEGYAKAFQYLCDLSNFDDSSFACYTVTGDMDGGTGNGDHMWNIVTLGGINYLVDVTNSDDGTAGEDGGLFMTYTDGSVEDGYAFKVGGQTITYRYDDNTKALYGENILALGKVVSAEPVASVEINGTVTEYESLTGDDGAWNYALNNSTEDTPATVTLLKNVDLGTTALNMDKGNVVIEMEDGVSLTGNVDVEIAESGMISVSGGTLSIASGTVENKHSYGYGLWITSGTVNVSGTGTVIAPVCAVVVIDGTVNVSGGNIKSSEVEGTPNKSDHVGLMAIGGNVHISGGSVESDGYGIILDGGNLSISEGSVEGVGYGVVLDGGSLSVSGGSIESGGCGVMLSDGSLRISEGASISGTAYGIASVADNTEPGTRSITITGGEIKATGAGDFGFGLALLDETEITISGGRFSGTQAAITAIIDEDESFVVGDMLSKEEQPDKYYAYYETDENENKSLIADTNVEALTGTVEVAACDHSEDAQYENQGDTHAAVCPACGKVGTPEEHQWNNDGICTKCLAERQGTSIRDAVITIDGTFTYDGTEQMPEPVVTLDGRQLTADQDYTVSYENNTDAGMATVIITGAGEYNDTCSTTFTIEKATPVVVWTNTEQKMTYNGSGANITEPEIMLVNNETYAGEIIYSYTTGDGEYTDGLPINAGTYTIKASISESKNYTAAEGEMTLTIERRNITVTPLAGQSKIIGETEPVLKYEITDGSLVSEDHLTGTLSREAGEGIGTYAIKQGSLQAADNYTLTFTDGITFEIKAKTLDDAEIVVNGTYEYTGSPLTPNLTVKLGNTTLTEGKEYEIETTNNINAGEAGFIIKGIGAYTGERSGTFEIKRAKPTCAAPENLVAEYGSILEDVLLTNPDGNTPGAWSWKEKDAVVGAVGEQTHQAVFTPDDDDNYESAEVPVTVRVTDSVAPVGEITVGENSWTSFLNTITFGHFFKNTQKIEITGEDNTGTEVTIQYLLTDTEKTQEELKQSEWKSYSEAVSVEPGKYIVYAKITDASGNMTVINSEGIVVYTDSVAVTENIVFTKTSTEDVTASVELNGNTVKEVICGTQTLTENEDYTVSESGITFKADYLNAFEAGSYTLTVSYDPQGVSYVEAEENEAPSTTAIGLTVEKGSGSVEITEVLSKTYDGRAIEAPEYASAGGGDATVEYKAKGADDSSYTAEAPKKAGEYTVRVTVAEDGNYKAASDEKDFTISKKTVSIEGVQVEQSKEYDGTVSAKITDSGRISGICDGDMLEIVAGIAEYENKDVGTDKAVSFSGFELGGADAANYMLSSQPKDAAANITAKELTVTVVVKDKLYDGKTDAEIESASLNGVVEGDSIDLVVGTASFASAEIADDITVTFEGFGITGADAGNYTLVQPSGITASIKEYTAVKDVDYSVNTNEKDWTNELFTVTATDGRLLSASGDPNGTWTEQLSANEEMPEGELTFYVKDANGVISAPVTVSFKIDKTAPTGEITVDTSKWREFLNTITFERFFKDTQKVEISAEDAESGVDKLEYYLASESMSKEEVTALEDAEWTECEDGFYIDPNHQYVIYIKITDQAGNISYISSDGLVLDNVAPVITGVQDGGTYYGKAEFTVTDPYLDSVVIDNEEVAPADGGYSIAADNGEHTIIATDKSGNRTVYTIKVYDESKKPSTGQTDDRTDGGKQSADKKSESESLSGTPKTGDNSQIGLWLALMLLSCAGFAGAVVRRKK